MEPTEPLSASRRAVLGASATLLAAGPVGAANWADEAEAQRVLERYQSFGDKASGGPGDKASGEWLEGELQAMGYVCQRQTYDMPAYEGEAVLTCGEARAELIPQAVVAPTSPSGVRGPIYIAGPDKRGAGWPWWCSPTRAGPALSGSSPNGSRRHSTPVPQRW